MTGVSIDGCFVLKPGGPADAVVIDAVSATATATTVNTEYVRNLIAAPSCVVWNPTTSRFRRFALVRNLALSDRDRDIAHPGDAA
jgi:hypothetical protein